MNAERLIGLLTYIEEIEKLRFKPVFSVPTEFFAAYQHELHEVPDVRFNDVSEGDDVWLRIPRLHENAPPDSDDMLRPWMLLSRDPESPPKLRQTVDFGDAEREISTMRLENQPHIRSLFDRYIESRWEPWANLERPRRKTIEVYRKLFSLHQMICSEGAETSLELVWGIGMAHWKRSSESGVVKYPLLLQTCDISFDARSLEICVRPRSADVRLEIGCYVELQLPGVERLEEQWKQFQATSAHRVNPFDLSTYEPVLRAAVAHLDPSGSVELGADGSALAGAGDQLRVTDTWVLFARRRRGDVLMEDLQRLTQCIRSGVAIPSAARSFVEDGDTAIRPRPEVSFRGLAAGSIVQGAKELYFPMPYNDEQLSVICKLESNDAVVVQGPPGTGKTHTIANVVCHFLAQGKRVLVTSKGETALAALQERLPERIRSLCVALLSDERDGMKQFEEAIQSIAKGVAQVDPERSVHRIRTLQAELDNLHEQIVRVAKSIDTLAIRHMRRYAFQGREATPEEMARVVFEERHLHNWFDDRPAPPPQEGLGFKDSDIAALREARIQLGADLHYLTASLPANEELPSWTALTPLQRDLLGTRTIAQQLTQGMHQPLKDLSRETLEKAHALAHFLEERAALRAMALTGEPWVLAFAARLASLGGRDSAILGLLKACDAFNLTESMRKFFVGKAIQVPAEAELDENFVAAVHRLAEGRAAFETPTWRSATRRRLKAVLIGSLAPASQSDWETVRAFTNNQLEMRRVVARWRSLCAEFELPGLPAPMDEAVRVIAQYRSRVVSLHRFLFEFETHLADRIVDVFGSAPARAEANQGEAQLETLRHALRAHLDRAQLAGAMKSVAEILQRLEGRRGPIVESIKMFLATKLGQLHHDEDAQEQEWMALQGELARLNSLRPVFAQVERISGLIESAGAPNWARRVRTEPAVGSSDAVVPTTWLNAWNWRLASSFLDHIGAHKRLRRKFDERLALSATLARTYLELATEKTWLGLFNNSPERVRQALQAYLNAIQSSQSATGLRASRHRRNAREAMQKAYQAVPCWVLPQWRVSEAIPPELGLFDLVVIDEASQSDIGALVALLRGKKLLIVGDHRQVSPSTVGIAEQQIVDLDQRFLRAQPHGRYMTPEQSIYDLARVVFAANCVMLREHFRCAPAIIEFSNREFYQRGIVPLRIPRPNERLDPTLVDVFVKGGRRQGDVNEPEAQAIVEEIVGILADSRFDGRSVGVVTLLGTAQAARIQDLVHRRIAPSEIVARKILVGPPPVFQGTERDIMLVSMVLAPGDRAAQARVEQHQRFNVALSRARDRVYLFRSATQDDFANETLNARLIGHFQQPFAKEVHGANLRERCESPFEVELFDELTARGYRVTPQVPCGDLRIDLVIEGAEGRRLAIECDGDRFCGPEQWTQELNRQLMLERAGWSFCRCFAANFVRRRDEVLEDLCLTLNQLGIKPLGADTIALSGWVEHRILQEKDAACGSAAPVDANELHRPGSTDDIGARGSIVRLRA